MLPRRCATAPLRPQLGRPALARPQACVMRLPQLQVPLLHQRGTRSFRPVPDDWLVDPKNFSLTHHIPVPPPPTRPPPHPWRMVPPMPGLTVEKFLKKIGKGCEEHAEKFESWDELMAARTWELKMLDIPVRQRKWILKHTWKYREGRLNAWRWDYPEVGEW